MKPISFDHTIEQGADYSYQLTIVDENGVVVDVSNADIQSLMKKEYTSTQYVAFTISKIDPVNGVVIFSLSANDTSTIKAGTYVYDVMYKLNTSVNKVVSGYIVVNPSSSSF